MLDLIYEQTYTMKWKYLAAMLDMFNPQIGKLPDDQIVDEMIEEEYIIYDREKKEFHLSSQYRMLVDSFLSTCVAVNIEAPMIRNMQSSLSLYYLQNHRHMLVLIQNNEENKEDGFVEIAISSKKSSPTKLFERVGFDLGVIPVLAKEEAYDPDNLPNDYKDSYDSAIANNRLFRVTLYEQEDDKSDGALAVFAAFPGKDNLIWVTAMRQKFNKKERPILVKKVSEADYKQQLTTFFDLFEKQIW